MGDLKQRLAQAEAELEQALAREQKALETSQLKSEFLANMSHEIRTPLSGVVTIVDLLLKTEMNSVQRDYVEMIAQSSEALMAILNDVLDLSKIRSGTFELDVQPFEFSKLLSDVVKTVQVSATQKNLELTLSIAPDLRSHRVSGDALRIRQILFNLLQNATKFTEQGRIDVRVLTIPNVNGRRCVRLEVEDTGIGIETAAKDLIFRAYQQAHASIARKFGGTGLGLTICRKLVGVMKGEIGVDSAPGVGSLFWVHLPLEIEAAEIKPTPLPNQRSDSKLVSARILVAEDDPINQQVILRVLKQQGHNAELASTGKEVLRKIAMSLDTSEAFDLILMDCHMPEMDGFKAAKALRDLGVRTPIVALTADVLTGTREKCRQSGMNGYLVKPFEQDRLNQIISDLMTYGRAPEFEASIVRAEGPRRTRRKVLNMHVLRQIDRLNEPSLSDLTVEIVETFLKDAPVRLAHIRQALADGQADVVQLEAHSLKSVSALLGAEVLSALCADLEKRALRGKPERLTERLSILEDSYKETEALLLNFFTHRAA